MNVPDFPHLPRPVAVLCFSLGFTLGSAYGFARYTVPNALNRKDR